MDIEDAEELVLKALAPLGTEYVNKLKEAFNSNWMDAYLSPNKRGGAYNMPVYGVHPYVLLLEQILMYHQSPMNLDMQCIHIILTKIKMC